MRSFLVVSGLLNLFGHFVELIETSIAEPFRQNLEQFNLFRFLLDCEVHQQGLQQIQDHIHCEKYYHEDVYVGFVLVAVEHAHQRDPYEPVQQSYDVDQVFQAAFQIYYYCPADVAHDEGAEVSWQTKNYSNDGMAWGEVEVYQNQEGDAVLQIDNKEAQFEQSSGSLGVGDVVHRKEIFVIDIDDLLS